MIISCYSQITDKLTKNRKKGEYFLRWVICPVAIFYHG